MDRVLSLDLGPSPSRSHCCTAMSRALSTTCEQHPDRFDCADALVHYSAQFDEYGLIVHDGGASYVLIRVCPWCGARLPEPKRDRWFDELEALGFDDPVNQEIPAKYRGDAWYREPRGSTAG